MNILSHKPTRLFVLLSGFFVANAMIAELIGVKIFSVEKTIGITPLSITLFGESSLSFNMTAGVLTWPLVFVFTDIINEYYGHKGVRFLSYLTAALIAFAFVVFMGAIHLAPADFWVTSHLSPALSDVARAQLQQQVSNYDTAFGLVLGQSVWIIIGSLVAFLIGQLVDVLVFHRIKALTGEDKIWLRATGSTLVSQFIDSFVVLFIAFYIGADWKLSLVLAIGFMNYIYKFAVAILITPVVYALHYVVENYLGHDVAAAMKQAAAQQG